MWVCMWVCMWVWVCWCGLGNRYSELEERHQYIRSGHETCVCVCMRLYDLSSLGRDRFEPFTMSITELKYHVISCSYNTFTVQSYFIITESALMRNLNSCLKSQFQACLYLSTSHSINRLCSHVG